MQPIRFLSAAGSALLLGVSACSSSSDPSTGAVDSGRQYGPAQAVGNGTVRAYIVTAKDNPNTPTEIGVAMSEDAVNGLPAGVVGGNMTANMHMYTLVLPTPNPTPYQFAQFDWNPLGHEPAGVYDLPHFDFHFYTVPVSTRDAILPTDPQYAAKAANFPTADFRAPFHVDAGSLAGAPAVAATVPQMGLHWLDVRSPELQALAGHPENAKAFTKTFIYGSWDGKFIFDEPMITRAYLLTKHDATDAAVRDELIPVSTAAHYAPTGFYPGAYRITYDAAAKEYRVALTQLASRN